MTPPLIIAAMLLITQVALAENWPQFRGPGGQGQTVERNLPVAWGGSENKNVLWKSPLKGQGHASPIVWGDFVFVCTAQWPNAAVRRESVIPEQHVTCYRASDGTPLWDTLVPAGPWLRNDFRSGPGGGYAAATPVTDGKRVYCAFGSSVMAAIDFEGKLVWQKPMLPYTFDVTVGNSPVLYGDTVLMVCAAAKPADSRVMAFDRNSGEMKWEQKLPGTAFGHSTPLLIDIGGKPQMLIVASGMQVAGNALQAVAPADGRRIWWCRGAGDVPMPVFGDGLVYFDCGRGGPGTAVDPTGSGDVSATHIRWTIQHVPEGLCSPIVVGDYLYRLHAPGVLKCYEMKTGKEVYSKRLEGLQTTWASPIADADGRLFFATAGKSFVVQAGPEFKLLGTSDLGDSNHPSPAASGGRLFLVGMRNIYCVGEDRK
ncbi:MAG: PQQ-binding-like beta-propeller repeat protein [Tepidisphaeraceae bacterium]|jgi:outer membrane protein assembly factor BamB